MPIGVGFPRQRLSFLSRPTVTKALGEPTTSALLVTDAGWFPEAADHYCERASGHTEHVIIICAEGSGYCSLDGAPEFAINAGDVLVIPAQTPHRYWADADDPWTIWWLHLSGFAAPELVRSAAGKGGLTQHPVDLVRVISITDEALRIMEHGESAAALQAAAGCAWHLMGLLGLATDTKRPAPVERAMAVMADRIDGSISVPELARMVNLSPSHFASLFRESTGTSVLHYFIAMKMGVARQLLDADESVGDVAARLGFADPFYFSRQFRRFHGVSPNAYRTERRRPLEFAD